MDSMRISVLAVIFWVCISAVIYNYLGYPFILFALSVLSQAKSDLLFLIRRAPRRCSTRAQDLPRVALLMSAYNEEQMIEAKVRNCFDLEYAPGQLEILIGLDASTDSTPEILARFESTRLQAIRFPVRQGKLKVLFALAQKTTAEILVITDADTILDRNCIQNLARHFADSHVGAVSGEFTRVVSPGADPSAELLYWRYESALKVLENRLNCSLGANGNVFAVRRSLFHLSKPSIVEDLQIPLEIRFQGYRVVYDPEATATEELTPTLSAQFARRVRIGVGNFQTLFGNFACLDPRKGLLAFCYFSHRVLRWLGPILLLTAFFCSLLMVSRPDYAILAAAQVVFYLAALLGYWRKKQAAPAGVFSVPFHFCAMNLAMLVGMLKYLRGHQSIVWATPRTVKHEAG
jgi:biofilm PGA synthesis N-glycosyltransferase PgaC